MERDAFRGALVEAGFEPVGADDGRFFHQVDSAITRDLMIARRAV
jgi:hypothetical protein